LTRRHRQQSNGRGGEVRPTTSRVLSALFSMFGPEGVRGLSVLDLYAGTGGFGLEALRRGAVRLVMVERDYGRCQDLKLAVAKLDAEDHAKVIRGDVLRSVPVLEGPFDVVFADPPYADDPFEALAARLIENRLIPVGGTVILEHFQKTQLPDVLAGMKLVTRRRYGDAAVSVYRLMPETGSDAEQGNVN
jgi:16S rRNA (guanine966-N2)-methyltransferase